MSRVASFNAYRGQWEMVSNTLCLYIIFLLLHIHVTNLCTYSVMNGSLRCTWVFQWVVLQTSNHYLSFKIDLLKEEVCCSEIRGKFFGSDKNLTFSVYFKSFFLDMGIFPKKHLKRRIWKQVKKNYLNLVSSYF